MAKNSAFTEEVVEALALAMVVTNEEGAILWANSEMQSLLGGSNPESILGKNLQNVLSKVNKKEEVHRNLVSFWKEQKPKVFKFSLQLENGQQQWLEVQGVPLEQKNHLLISFQDVSKLIRYESQLRESQTRWRSIADNAATLIWIANSDMLITFCNRAWCSFVGRPMELELGFGWTDNLHPDEYGYLMDMFKGIFANPRPFQVEYRLRKADGSYGWLLERGVPIYDHENEFTGIVGTCFDITDRKEAELNLRRQGEILSLMDSHYIKQLQQQADLLEIGLQMMPSESEGETYHLQLSQALAGVRSTLDNMKHSISTKPLSQNIDQPEVVFI